MAGSKAFKPYVGPGSFLREDAPRFFGRDDVSHDLLSLIISARTVLLYAQSGAGKTSLINAGLRPLLEEKGFDILPLARVQGLLPEGLRAQELDNPYTHFTLVSWGEQPDVGVAVGSIVQALERRPRPQDRYGDPAPRLLIFDQFEELFTAFPECWRERTTFLEELTTALAADERLRILFAIREDYLADIFSIGEDLPDGLRNRLRLARLRKDEALEAIQGPLDKSGVSYGEGVAEQLADDLMAIRSDSDPKSPVDASGEFVEPLHLQVVCTELWQSLPPGTTTITADDVRLFGNVTLALANYYDDAIAKTAMATAISPAILRHWFENVLITTARTRGTAFRGDSTTEGLPNEAVLVLDHLHMIRADSRAHGRWYELTHDRFIGPIQQSNSRARRWTNRDLRGVTPLAVAAGLASPLLLPDQDIYGRIGAALRITAAVLSAIGAGDLLISAFRHRGWRWRRGQSSSSGRGLARIASAGGSLTLALFPLAIMVEGWQTLIRSPRRGCGSTSIVYLVDHSGRHTASACTFVSSREVGIGLLLLTVGAVLLIVAAGPPVVGILARRARRRLRAAGNDAIETAGRATRIIVRGRGQTPRARATGVIPGVVLKAFFGVLVATVATLVGLHFFGYRQLTLHLAPGIGHPGTQVNITGHNFLAQENIRVRFDGQIVAESGTNSAGTFRSTFTVPNADPGFYQVIASDDSFTELSVASFTISRP